ncbi:Glycoside hydrolase [Trema orientale]|uniref:chitinase n=1 Tax=Trema orientale TaxID=63057 RepID=A0A2P5FLH8_TREOI|nr:Glycoside hydrolase [Trema orientale]
MMKQLCCPVFATLFSLLLATSAYQYQCGNQANFNRVCEDGNCCSTDGFCGTGDQYCSVELCQSQCPDPTEDPHDVSALITAAVFDTLNPNRNDDRCPGHGFYTYESFLEAARRFPEFGTTGSYENRRRELAAFFGQTSALTGEGWPGADNGGEFAWGYCFVDLNYTGNYCIEGVHGNWPCVEGKSYRPRGPIELT